MDANRSARYQRYPLIRIVEWLVLDMFGLLAETEDRAAAFLVNQVVGPGDWRSVMRRQLGFDADNDARVLDAWRRFRDDAARVGNTVTPREFAEFVADQWAERELVGKQQPS
jgi:hypothetical protein